jgi:hypothetical protein
LKDGDANTRMFHMHARHRKRKNFIAKLKTEDRVLIGHEEKAEAILDFYSKLIGSDDNQNRTINLEALELPSYELDDLEYPISEEEVWNTIKSPF